MSSRVFIVVGLLATFLFLVSSEVAAAREMSETSTSNKATATIEGDVHPDQGGYGGYPGGGYGGYPGRGGGGYGGYPGRGGGGYGGYPGRGGGGYGGYPGGGGGYPGGGGGYPGRCPYGRCCGREYCRCCYYAGEEAYMQAEGKPLN